MSDNEKKTPLLDQLEGGPWPSFVGEIKKAAETSPAAADLLGLLERSYEDRVGHWKHGGLVGVRGYGGGVIGRYSDLPEEFPEAAQFHTLRVNHPAGWFYTSDSLRTLCDVWDQTGSGLTNLHGSTGDIILLGCKTEQLQESFDKLAKIGFDLGGSGSSLRTPSCCVGPGRCEWSCYDTLGACDDITRSFQDELHRPRWPYKFKIKFAGCPNDCVASIARSDCSVIGTWLGPIQVDAEAVAEYADSIDILEEVVMLCPTRAIRYRPEDKSIRIDNDSCTRCMHCINVMPKALRPGAERGATVLIGGKAPILKGAILSHVIIPFIRLDPPFDELKDFLTKTWDWWDEHGRPRERIGELIKRLGLPAYLKAVGLELDARMVAAPRSNPYVFYRRGKNGPAANDKTGSNDDE